MYYRKHESDKSIAEANIEQQKKRASDRLKAVAARKKAKGS